MTDVAGDPTLRVPLEPPAEVTVLRRVVVVDAELRVLLCGSARERLVESAGRALPPEIAAEVRTLIRTHDFTRRPIATGLAGPHIALRVVRSVGPAGAFYTIFSERTLLRRRLANVASRFALDSEEAALLRLVAGGYPFAEIERRMGIDRASLRKQLRGLEQKAGCAGRRALASLVFATSPSAPDAGRANSRWPVSFPDADSSTYPARRGDNRLR